MYLSNLYAEKIFSEHPLALWALDEEFDNSTTPETISNPTFIIDPIQGSVNKGLKAVMYGSSEHNGWYLHDGSKYYADNSGVPMVYGASNVTGLYPFLDQTSSQYASVLPSLILPGFGFLNEIGQYKEYTLEAWLRITANTSNGAFRIIGPIQSNDGIYVDGSYITLKINNYTQSHFIDSWERPMLIQLSINKNGAYLIINGEKVISILFDISKISFPYGDNTDWIGFYLATDSVNLIDVDCVAIYPFLVSETVAKRRFAYGQAVQYPQNLLANYGGSSAVIDYSFANYAKNYNYPQIGKWQNGKIKNLLANSDYLTVPNYKLPTVKVFSGTQEFSLAEWENAIASKNINTSSEEYLFSMTPETGAAKDPSFRGYMKFDSLNNLINPVVAVAGTFVLNEEPETHTQTLFKIQNNYDGRYLEVEAELASFAQHKANINIWINDGSSITKIKQYANVPTMNNEIFVGISFVDFSALNSTMSDFFANPQNLSLYIAASKEIVPEDSDLSKTKAYLGDIGKIHLLDSDSYAKLLPYVSVEDKGQLFSTNASNSGFADISNFVGSYTLFFTKMTNRWIPNDPEHSSGSHLDIAIDASWQDYVPLSYMQKKIDDGTYALDFMQFNISHFSNTHVNPLTNKIESNDMFKAYASFQYSDSYVYQDYSNIELLETNYVVKPAGTEWNNKKYEIVDNTVIYPPENIDVNTISLVIKLNFKIMGILKNPMAVKSLQVASVALNKNSDTLIGTRLGLNFKPYNNSTGVNPFRIYKEASPYLYMSDKSGIQVVGNVSESMDRGLALIVNPSKSSGFYLSTMQMFMKYNMPKFSSNKEPFFEIKNKKSGYEHLKFYTIATNSSGSKGKIEGYVVNNDLSETKISNSAITYYVDGHQHVTDPDIELNEWHIFAINFPKLLDFSDSSDYTINLTGPMLVNNLSYFRVDQGTVSQKTKTVPWSDILGSPSVTWDSWKLSSSTWADVLYESFDDIKSIDPDTIYQIYLGTNRIVVDNDNALNTLRFKSCSYVIYDRFSWQSEIIKPV